MFEVKVRPNMAPMWVAILVLAVSGGNGNEPEKNATKIYARPVRDIVRGRNRGDGFGNPADWTMSKAKLVAEFFTSEPSGAKHRLSRSGQNIMQNYFYGNSRGNGSVRFPEGSASDNSPPQWMVPPPLVNGGDKQLNLVASGTSYSPQAVPFDFVRAIRGGFATPFRPINPQQQSYVVPITGGNGYFSRPPRGEQQLSQPSQYYGWEQSQINGLRPPLLQQQPPPPQYLPPQGQSTRQPVAPPPPPKTQPVVELPKYDQSPVDSPSPPYSPPKEVTTVDNPVFTPSQQYLPVAQFKPEPSPPVASQYKPVAPPPPLQIAGAYSKQTVYPGASDSQKYSSDTPTFVTVNSSYQTSQSSSNQAKNTLTSYPLAEANPPSPPASPSYQIPPPIGQTLDPSQLSSLSSPNNPLSDVLADANLKAGDAMDKTIRFVIHKPEDEDVIKNAILENAHNRYEDVRFVQGPTLKVQRKETVYLPPKKKTVVYILLKEPQIDTDVQVMSPDDDEPVPEVYITYQKPDGAVKTKHYSPKPMKPGDIQKYLDVDQESSYSSDENVNVSPPRISKSTSVSTSTSSSTKNLTDNSALLENHRMTPLQANETNSAPPKRPSIYYPRAINQTQFASFRRPVSPIFQRPQKKPRSSDFSKDVEPPHKRFFRTVQCPTSKPIT